MAPQLFFPLLSLYGCSVLPSSNMLSEGIITGLGATQTRMAEHEKPQTLFEF